jgi:hypothetical protein
MTYLPGSGAGVPHLPVDCQRDGAHPHSRDRNVRPVGPCGARDSSSTPRKAHARHGGPPGHHPLSGLDERLARFRHKDFDPRAELDHAQPLTSLDRIALPDPTHDAPGQDPGDLADQDALGSVGNGDQVVFIPCAASGRKACRKRPGWCESTRPFRAVNGSRERRADPGRR